MFGRKKKKESLVYDKDRKTPVIRCSICNGEQVGGLKDKETGQFEEIMLIRTGEDLEAFRRLTGETEIAREY